MRNTPSAFILLLGFSLLVPPPCWSQEDQSVQWSSSDPLWETASLYWNHQKYSAAQASYTKWIEENRGNQGTNMALARFRETACAIQLQHANTDHLIQTFLTDFPEHPLVREAQWMYANYLYRKRDWKDAVTAYGELNTLRMSEGQKLERQFKLGHSHFELEAYDEARLDLYAVIQAGENAGQFADPAQYYFSHISYLKGQPTVALEGFRALESKKEFSNVVPVYIAQLLHETDQFEELITYAPKVFHPDADINEVQRASVARLVGDALYRLQRFEEALPYLEDAYFFSRGHDRTRDFSYQMGFTYYKAREYRKAINCFSLVVREEDELGQLALYQLADCYLSLNEKDKARTTFKKASTFDYDTEIQEDALFSYAKLAYELTYNPFDDAITAIERYLREYPNSKRRDEAYGFLLEVYMSSKNYDRALQALKLIENKSPDVKSAYQLVSYNRGVELFRSGSYLEAMPYFQEVRTYPVDPVLTAESHFWQGELHYLLKEFTEATAHYASFESSPGAYQSAHYANGIYARGYALFKRKKYVDALSAFRSYLKTQESRVSAKTQDAKLRAGDCYYANKDFEAAARYYSEVINESELSEDYAQFQRAACLGSLNRKLDQIEALRELIKEVPQSSYIPEAMYALGRSLIETNDLIEAQTTLSELRQQFPNSPKNKYALVDLCLISVKLGQDDQALSHWDEVRTSYGQDPIAGDAFNVIEPLLIDRGLLDNIPSGVGLNGDEIEERLFSAARDFALQRNCEKALLRLNEYIRTYETGRFLTEAHFFAGNCAYDMNQPQEARRSFELVLQAPVGDFTEAAALGAATIAWNEGDIGVAKNHYRILEAVSIMQENQLEARIGLMRCHYLLDEKQEAMVYANQVINDEKTPDDIKRTAHYWRGKLNYEASMLDQARPDLELLAEFGGARGAECGFILCDITFQSGDYEATETQIFQFIDRFAAYDQWKFKSFLMLVDCYIQAEDWFQARTTAQSILEFVESTEIREVAEEQLLKIDQLELAAIESASSNAQDSIPGQNADTIEQD